MKHDRITLVTALAATLAAFTLGSLVGCGQGHDHADAAHDQAADAVQVAKDAAEDAAENAVQELTGEAREAALTAVLEAADAADGESDKVVTKCPGCRLAMDGKAEHAHEVGDYQLHFCSASCSEHFNDDTEASLLALRSEIESL